MKFITLYMEMCLLGELNVEDKGESWPYKAVPGLGTLVCRPQLDLNSFLTPEAREMRAHKLYNLRFDVLRHIAGLSIRA